MPIIIGIHSEQISFSSLESHISKDNEVRFIDAFVDMLDLRQLGIVSLIQSEKKKAGRASFEDSLFLKLYLYAYLNGLRSSRRLEKETQPDYLIQHFKYNKEDDIYTCPQGEALHTTGIWHIKKRSKDISYQFKKYRTTACNTCLVKHLCTGRHDGRREIERSEYAEAVERNKGNYESIPQQYRRRQEINEHIFGTIKRQWNLYYTNLRGLEKVNGELALIMTVYNIKRTKNIIGFDKLMEILKNWSPKYPGGTFSTQIRLEISPFKPLYYF